jgi:hypothetical protein
MYPWYDSWWLADLAKARAALASTPAVLERFDRDIDLLRTRPSFTTRVVDGVLDDETRTRVAELVASLRPADLDLSEAQSFGRFISRNQPYLSELQRRLTPFMSEQVGEPVEPTYNFLSLYGAPGVCTPHMDAPNAKWTLDVCLAQSAPWPIHFSQVVPWPEPGVPGSTEAEAGDWARAVLESPALSFEAVALEPGQAVIFSGSSQWHYRDRMPPGPGRRFCELLFFHYVPVGTRDLVCPDRWADLYDAPQLEGLSPPLRGVFI